MLFIDVGMIMMLLVEELVKLLGFMIVMNLIDVVLKMCLGDLV